MKKRFTRALLALLLYAAAPTWAAISTSMIFEVSTTGSNSNGGCFKEGASGTDFTINAGKYNFTNLASSNGTTNPAIVSSASHNFVAADVGNCLRVTAGTSWTAGIYEIVSVSSNNATLDRAVGSSASLTNGTFFVGGPLLTLAQLNTDMCAGCRAYVHADGTYTQSAKVTLSYSTSGLTWIAGYSSVRGDNGQATIQASSAFGDYLLDANFGGNQATLRNFIFDVNSQGSSTRCVRLSRETSTLENIECKNATAPAGPVIAFDNHDQVGRNIYVHDVTYTGSVGLISNIGANTACYSCTIRAISGNAAIGFLAISCYSCVVDSMTGTTTDGFRMGNVGFTIVDHCTVYNITRDAINVDQSNTRGVISNCIFHTVLNGIASTGGTTYRAGDLYNDYNFTFNASGSATVNITAGSHSSTLSLSPFNAASSHDFRLNNNSTGGAAVRAHGFPPSMPGTLGSNYIDAGALQHQDPKFLR